MKFKLGGENCVRLVKTGVVKHGIKTYSVFLVHFFLVLKCKYKKVYISAHLYTGEVKLQADTWKRRRHSTDRYVTNMLRIFYPFYIKLLITFVNVFLTETLNIIMKLLIASALLCAMMALTAAQGKYKSMLLVSYWMLCMSMGYIQLSK